MNVLIAIGIIVLVFGSIIAFLAYYLRWPEGPMNKEDAETCREILRTNEQFDP
jgi:hypothetical protein